MTSLLIVESPAKCSKIQGFLGNQWKVIATMGHIRALDETLDAVGIDRDFEPTYKLIKEKAKAIQQLRECASSAKTIFLAADDDREGEAIAYSVAVLLKLNPATTPRIVFHEITKEAITAAVKTPTRINMNRVNAQQARSILDMLVGFTISPLLWKFVGQGLSAGRCQTPALRLVTDREAEITSFVAETSWAIKGQWQNATGATFEALLADPLEDEESATNYLENLSDTVEGVVTNVRQHNTSESPPAPLITSTLQQEASALYGSQPKNTMKTAQRLYEQGYITYMRTDCPVISEGARAEAIEYVKETYGEPYVAPIAAKPPSSKKREDNLAQQAHEAIRPTHIETSELPTGEDWSAIDRKIYRLIWNRTVQSVMAAARSEVRDITLRANGDNCEFDWLAKWVRVIFQGWRKIGQVAANLDEEAAETISETNWAVGLSLEVGTPLSWSSITATPKETRSPARYTEATLVRELEKRGIGRPSTFAALIGTILDKLYVEKRDTKPTEVNVKSLSIVPGQTSVATTLTAKKVGAEKQKLVPTALGLSALEFCVKEFDTLFAYNFTRQMEQRLDAISEGKEDWKGLCKNTWESYRVRYEELKAQTSTQMSSARQHVFSNGIKAIQTKKGPLLLIEAPAKEDTVFYGWPQGVAFSAITEALATAHVNAAKKEKEIQYIGDFEGTPMNVQTGPFGKYVACGTNRIPWTEGDSAETIRNKLKDKRESVLHTLGAFEFRRGPYGIYMFKTGTTGAARKFIGLPAAIDPKTLTEAAAIKIYQTGLQQKAKQKAYGNKNKT